VNPPRETPPAPGKPRAPTRPRTRPCSITVTGVGMHDGERCAVRISPAHAGEGRYFVRSSGSDLQEYLERTAGDDEGAAVDALLGEESEVEEGRTNLEAFYEYLSEQELTGYKGTFEEWAQEQGMAHLSAGLKELHQRFAEERDPPASPDASLPRIAATAENAAEAGAHRATLRAGGHEVHGAEHLLAALEACGVDNACVEVEGGAEVPMLDGAALGWTDLVHRVGLVDAATRDGGTLPRTRPVVGRPVHVTGDGGAFMSFLPGGGEAVISAGVAWAEGASPVGKVWTAWSADRGEHFRFEVAPAKTCLPDYTEYKRLRKDGLYRAATERQLAVGRGFERWSNPDDVTFLEDEPSRHKVIDVLGDLSLLAAGGNSGLPRGHVVAWQADHALAARFVRELAEAVEGDEPYEERALLSEEEAQKRIQMTRQI